MSANESRRDLRVAVDYSLMRNYGDHALPPIAGWGTGVSGGMALESWCGYCGYTGRVKGPRQASCPERNGWHRWLEKLYDLTHEMLLALPQACREARRGA